MFSFKFIDKIRLLFCSQKESYLRFYEILGFFPHDIKPYQQAIIHKSTIIEGDKSHLLSNERLEFLGDAILDAIVGDIVYRHFTGRREGFLTNTRSKVVQRETLNKLAVQIGLDKLVQYGNHSSSHNSYMYGNAFEALIGAIYLDQGYKRCMQFMKEKILKEYLDLDKMSRVEVNFKSKLIEWGQRNKMNVSFDLCEQKTDKDNNPIFVTEIHIADVPVSTGIGYSKKESHQVASREAIRKLRDNMFVQRLQEAHALHSNDKQQIEETKQVTDTKAEESINMIDDK